MDVSPKSLLTYLCSHRAKDVSCLWWSEGLLAALAARLKFFSNRVDTKPPPGVSGCYTTGVLCRRGINSASRGRERRHRQKLRVSEEALGKLREGRINSASRGRERRHRHKLRVSGEALGKLKEGRTSYLISEFVFSLWNEINQIMHSRLHIYIINNWWLLWLPRK